MLKSGDIIFAYKEVPINVTSIVEDAHPVKIGVSDAYIIDRTIFCKPVELFTSYLNFCLTRLMLLFHLLQSSAGKQSTNTTRWTKRRIALLAAPPFISPPCRPASASIRAKRASTTRSTLSAFGALLPIGVLMAWIGTGRIGW